jgi:hypothetical protein
MPGWASPADMIGIIVTPGRVFCDDRSPATIEFHLCWRNRYDGSRGRAAVGSIPDSGAHEVRVAHFEFLANLIIVARDY